MEIENSKECSNLATIENQNGETWQLSTKPVERS